MNSSFVCRAASIPSEPPSRVALFPLLSSPTTQVAAVTALFPLPPSLQRVQRVWRTWCRVREELTLQVFFDMPVVGD